jgi:hypothetical protein
MALYPSRGCVTNIKRADTASVKQNRILFLAALQPELPVERCWTLLDYAIVLAAARLHHLTNGCWAEFQKHLKKVLI